MIIRVVKMTFQPQHLDEFRALFKGWKVKIRAFPGNRHLALWQDAADPAVFFTYSHWDSAEDLEAYRRSDVFAGVWPVVKALFASPAQAWTVERLDE